MIYRAQVALIGPSGGVHVTIPKRSRTARFGPCPTLVAGLELGDQVLVAPFAGMTDVYAVLGKDGGMPVVVGPGGGSGDVDGGGWDGSPGLVDGGAW